ncbi:unnamed protein product, partial [Soboliphyme baturini]|uniref:PAN domain protein n=1 Tax=Soboliphyme baturini TaxID=241478 RepID=A0A183IV49_9BILA
VRIRPLHNHVIDSRCYGVSAGCTLRNAAPFARQTPTSCEACLQLCQSQRKSTYPYICKSVIYDTQAKSCDLYAVDHQSTNAQLIKYPSRSYFRPTGQCDTGGYAPGAPVAPGVPSAPGAPAAPKYCPAGQMSKLIEMHGYVWPSYSGRSLQGYSLEECTQACVSNREKSGRPLRQPCKAARFSGGTCEVSSVTVPPMDSFLPDPSAAVFIARCMPEKIARGCPGNFELAPMHVLIGYAEAVVTADLEGCVKLCINERRFKCKSGMVYTKMGKENCVLNSETRLSEPSAYIADASEPVLYFDTKCNVTPMGSYATRLSDEPSNEVSKWTVWSQCHQGRKTRYLNCGKNDIRACPFETAVCDKSELLYTRISLKVSYF